MKKASLIFFSFVIVNTLFLAYAGVSLPLLVLFLESVKTFSINCFTPKMS